MTWLTDIFETEWRMFLLYWFPLLQLRCFQLLDCCAVMRWEEVSSYFSLIVAKEVDLICFQVTSVNGKRQRKRAIKRKRSSFYFTGLVRAQFKSRYCVDFYSSEKILMAAVIYSFEKNRPFIHFPSDHSFWFFIKAPESGIYFWTDYFYCVTVKCKFEKVFLDLVSGTVLDWHVSMRRSNKLSEYDGKTWKWFLF